MSEAQYDRERSLAHHAVEGFLNLFCLRIDGLGYGGQPMPLAVRKLLFDLRSVAEPYGRPGQACLGLHEGLHRLEAGSVVVPLGAFPIGAKFAFGEIIARGQFFRKG